MPVKPIGERVLLKPIKQEEKTGSGIYIPESAREEKKQGEVVAAGTYKDGSELPVKTGDKVIYGGFSSDEVEFDNEKYLFVDFKDILAKFE